MGFLLAGLDVESYDRSYSDRQLVQRIFTYLLPQWRIMLLAIAMILLNSVMNIVVPVLISAGLSSLADSSNSIALLVCAIVLSGGVSWVSSYLGQWFTAGAVGDVVLGLRQDAIAAVLKHDMSFFDSNLSGKTVSRVTSDTESFAAIVTLTLTLLSQFVQITVIATVLLWLDPTLALISVAVAPVIFVVAVGFRRIARVSVQRNQRALARINANILETLSGISVSKSFRQERSLYYDFSQLNKQAYYVDLRVGFLYNGIFPFLEVIAGLGQTLVIYVGGLGVLYGHLSVGEWYLFVQATNLFWFPLTGIAAFWSQFQQGLSASERVFSLIDAEPGVVQVAQEPVPALRGEVAFSHVSFGYVLGEDVLSDFSLVVPAGQRLAIVGHTGAGKTSLIRLVVRFYDFRSGQLLIDGRDIRCLDLGEYRQHIALVPQTTMLFSGTVADNIRYGKPDATDRDVRAAAVGIGDWLDGLPQNLQTDVGERGAKLSMGQRQLVALARAMIKNPAILILDEATASVDPFTELQIRHALDRVMSNRTSIIIAHRLSTIISADRIIVMRNGRIIEEGNHQQLLSQGGYYAELYNTYFRHQSLDYVENAKNLMSASKSPMLETQ